MMTTFKVKTVKLLNYASETKTNNVYFIKHFV